MIEAAAAGFFLLVMGAVFAAGYVVLERGKVFQDPAVAPTRAAGSLLGRTFQSVGELVPAAKEPDNPLRKKLAAAGYHQPSALAAFYGVKCAFAVAGAAILATAAALIHGNAASTLMPILGGAGIGAFIPARLLRNRIEARRERLRRALPTALDLCVLSIEAGQSLDQALMDASQGLRRSYPDLSLELRMVVREARAAADRTEALRNLGERTGEPELRKLAAVLTDADRFGTSIVPALRNHSRYSRIRMRQRAQETARKVGVKLVFPVFFLIFPSVILITLGPGFIMVMTQLRSALR